LNCVSYFVEVVNTVFLVNYATGGCMGQVNLYNLRPGLNDALVGQMIACDLHKYTAVQLRTF